MSEVRIMDLSLENQLERKVEIFREVNRDFEAAKARARYLGAWLFRMSNEMTILRFQISQQGRNEQLTVFDKDEYHEDAAR